MSVVEEVISSEPLDRPAHTIERDEARLFEAPPAPAMRFLGEAFGPLDVYRVPVSYEPMAFAPPQGVFEGNTLRLEWQTMNMRQPFYHRNADVDEIGYQICGERTLMTECGTIEFKPGQFCRIPVGVAHDNFGRQGLHLIFYMHGPAVAGVPPVHRGEHRVPPFAGWESRSQVEAITNCLGGPHCTIGYSMADEEMILNAAKECAEPLEVIEPDGAPGTTEWVYRAPQVWIGHTCLEPTAERRYRRRLCAEEIQFQAEGRRTLVSQRGVVTLEPGEFVRIPRGCAFASVSDEPCKYISVLTQEDVPAVKESVRQADLDVAGWLTRQGAAAPAVQEAM